MFGLSLFDGTVYIELEINIDGTKGYVARGGRRQREGTSCEVVGRRGFAASEAAADARQASAHRDLADLYEPRSAMVDHHTPVHARSK